MKSIVAGQKGQPKAVLLVGGPGNGKTDAVEGCIQQFDEELGAGGQLVAAFASHYQVEEGILPPRAVEVNFQDIAHSIPGIDPVIRLVQDATEKEPGKGDTPPETLLLDELRSVIDGSFNGLYICCVNRGILANTALEANQAQDNLVGDFLDLAVKAASGGPSAPPCWPLGDYQVALWPMDVESLVTPPTGEVGTSIAHQVLEAALADERWQQPCENKRVCPYCQNKLLLSKPAARDNLVKLLRYFELGSGKRWTFRYLYSLVSYLLIGDPSNLMIKGKAYSPCGWTAKQIELTQAKGTTLHEARVPYLLAGRLYHHRLFSNWPRLASGNHLQAQQAVLKGRPPALEHAEGFELGKRHYRTLKTLGNTDENNSISNLLKTGVSELLDPALLHGGQVLFTSQSQEWKGEVTAGLVDDRFSLSVKHGLDLVKGQLCPAERELLQDLAKADEALQDHHYPRRHARHAKLLQSSLRQFACRFAKRSLGVKHGVAKHSQLFLDYARLHDDSSQDKQLKKRIKNLINENGKMFKIPLSTTFGQPVAHRDRSVSLLVTAISPRLNKIAGNESRPAERLPYLQIHGRDIPLTFSLFKALGEIGNGLDEASLPREVFALIDEVKSVTAGQVARDKNYIDDSVVLEVGSRTYVLDIDGDSVTFQEADDE
ncbi:hypothetical protein KUV89_16965 [Marinobacter hydrocarbonoclasticus]|nr:hypothetical protein [Marinobacter nauticus]